MTFRILSYVCTLTLCLLSPSVHAVAADNSAEIVNSTQSIDPQSGLVIAKGMSLVQAHCSACHSPSLITQNAMSRERWLETIRWMQETQKLWPLGDAEEDILDYLSTWYGPKVSARRPSLAPHLLPK